MSYKSTRNERSYRKKNPAADSSSYNQNHRPFSNNHYNDDHNYMYRDYHDNDFEKYPVNYNEDDNDYEYHHEYGNETLSRFPLRGIRAQQFERRLQKMHNYYVQGNVNKERNRRASADRNYNTEVQQSPEPKKKREVTLKKNAPASRRRDRLSNSNTAAGKKPVTGKRSSKRPAAVKRGKALTRH
jgi:hypothetical protein